MLPERRDRPGTDAGAAKMSHRQELGSSLSRQTDNGRDIYAAGVKIDLDHFRARLLQDALDEASALYWRRRARALEQALSRPGDYRGEATPKQVAEQDERIREAVRACCARAQLYESGSEISAEVDAALAEVGP